MKKQIPIIVAALSVLVAVGGVSYGVKASNQKANAEKEAQALREQLAKGAVSAPSAMPSSASTPLVALKDVAGTNDLATLQEQLAARDAELERLRAELAGRRNRQDQPREAFEDRMARMKAEEPERYAEMVQRRTEFQERMNYEQANRLATFMDLDTSKMTPEELATHNLLVEKLSSIWDQTAQINPEQAPDREAMRAVFDTVREIRPLMEQERTIMFKQLGSEVGLSGSEANDFAAYAESIISATSLRMPGAGPGGGAGGRGRGAGGQ